MRHGFGSHKLLLPTGQKLCFLYQFEQTLHISRRVPVPSEAKYQEERENKSINRCNFQFQYLSYMDGAEQLARIQVTLMSLIFSPVARGFLFEHTSLFSKPTSQCSKKISSLPFQSFTLIGNYSNDESPLKEHLWTHKRFSCLYIVSHVLVPDLSYGLCRIARSHTSRSNIIQILPNCQDKFYLSTPVYSVSPPLKL